MGAKLGGSSGKESNENEKDERASTGEPLRHQKTTRNERRLNKINARREEVDVG